MKEDSTKIGLAMFGIGRDGPTAFYIPCLF